MVLLAALMCAAGGAGAARVDDDGSDAGGARGVLSSLAAPPGVLLWAEGRSGTASLYETLVASAHAAGVALLPCNGIKEGFKSRKEMLHMADGLGDCGSKAQRFRRPAVTHIKPMHLTARGRGVGTPGGLMRRARDAGFGLIVTVRRGNRLARQVSSFELRMKQARHAPGSRGWRDNADREFGDTQRLIDEWERSAEVVRRGVDKAKALGMTVVEVTFEQNIHAPCDVLAQIAAAAQQVSADASPPLPAALAEGCEVRASHTASSHRESSLEQRTSPRAAQALRAAFEGTAREWMLDVARLDPPQ